MRVGNQMALLACFTGWHLDYIGRLPALRFNTLINAIEYHRLAEIYRIEYRIGQVLCLWANDKTHKYTPEQLIGKSPKEIKPSRVSVSRQKPVSRLKRLIGKLLNIEVTEMENETYDVVLGDGETYKLPILDANMMEALEEEFDKDFIDLVKTLRARVLKSILYQMLQRGGYTSITRDQVGVLLNTKSITRFANVITQMV